MSQICTNSMEKIYVKVKNHNAHVYCVDAGHDADTYIVSIKIENCGNVYPFSCNGATVVDNKKYYFCNVTNGFFLEDDVEIITREEYIKETLNKEISKIKIPYECVEMGFDNFLCELHQAIVNSVNIICGANDYYNVPEWIKTTRMSFVNCRPSEIYFSHCTFKDDNNTDIELWVKCARPGVFIGRMGENIDYWESLLQAYIDKWCEAKNYRQIKLGVRIEEKDLFKYESSILSL